MIGEETQTLGAYRHHGQAQVRRPVRRRQGAHSRPSRPTSTTLATSDKADDADQQILRPTDLKNVCLVNKQLHSLAVKPLYRNVSLDLGSPNDTRLSAFLNPRNAGLKHIRQIRLYLANVRDKCNQPQQANFATRMLLEFLPEDILEEFRYTE